MKRKGFTLIEVLVSIALILLIAAFAIPTYLNCLKASRYLYLKEQTKLTLLEYVHYCADQPSLPEMVINDNVWLEEHYIDNTLFNNGMNSYFKTLFGPIDTTTLNVEGFNGVGWIPVAFSAKDSGAIEVSGLWSKVRVSYKVVGWDYIKERRYNYNGKNIVLGYTKPMIDSIVSDFGIDVDLTNVTIYNSDEGRIFINTEFDKWLNIYYQVPRYVSYQIKRPDVVHYSVNNNQVIFNSSAASHYVLVTYIDLTNVVREEYFKVPVDGIVALTVYPQSIQNVKCLTINGHATWKALDSDMNIDYITVINN